MQKHARQNAFTLSSLALLGLLIAPIARAATFYTGNVGQQINITITPGTLPVLPESGNALAGNFSGSVLDGTPLPFVYCVDLSHTIFMNSGPFNTSLNLNTPGQIHGVNVPNADQVTYLLDHYAATATTPNQTTALQSAIWKVIYGSQFTLNGPGPGTDAGVLTAYNAYLTNVGSDPVANLVWLSPFNADGSAAQSLVTSVPEPGNIALLLTAGLTSGGLLLRRRAQR